MIRHPQKLLARPDGQLTQRERKAKARFVKILEAVKQAALAIGFTGQGDFMRLADALDARGVKSLQGHRWRSKSGIPRTVYFVKTHCPDLLEPREPEPWTPPKIVMPVIGKRRLEALRVQVMETGQAVTHEPLPTVTQSAVTHNLLPTPHGWTLCHDKRGIYKAVKRIGGKLRSVYVGKDPSLSQEKVQVWLDKHMPRPSSENLPD